MITDHPPRRHRARGAVAHPDLEAGGGDGGAGLAEASDAVRRLTEGGVTGTRPEMELLAGRLRDAGATVDLEPA